MNIQEIEKAQEKWGNGIVKIGELKDTIKECRMFTLDFISKMYDYENGIVQFKPTKASDAQFRGDLKSALSYFIGSDSDFSEDKGFALNPWVKVDFENNSINIINDIAIAMGNYFFTDNEGCKTKVEYSFVYKKNEHGDLKIILHHSSLPFSK
tara:strand:- start:613 stop:1071 length:459 start_codon:yes stop_codon:yes gene_type:complete